MKVALRRIKGAIKPILDGEVIDAEDSKEAVRALKELIALLKGCDVASTNANTTHDVIAESESR
ncbi:hypothetical protein [Luteimonas saliphila]|uniref:hypothetical protein n=1 Tax=Luteimonas saliphila TaxID=2804919 RepID=UPI00192E0278|nr:hypothetical protein [Luteimonas saliphila]